MLVEVQILSSAPIYLTKFIVNPILRRLDAGWSSLVARRAHNPKVVGSNPAPATILGKPLTRGFLLPRLTTSVGRGNRGRS